MNCNLFLVLFALFISSFLYGQSSLGIEGYWKNKNSLRYYSFLSNKDGVEGYYYLEYNFNKKQKESFIPEYQEFVLSEEVVLDYKEMEDGSFDIDTLNYSCNKNCLCIGREKLIKISKLLDDKSFQEYANLLDGMWRLDTMFFEGMDLGIGYPQKTTIAEFKFTSMRTGILKGSFISDNHTSVYRETAFDLIKLGEHWFFNTHDVGGDIKFALLTIKGNRSFSLREVITIGGEVPIYKNHVYVKWK